MFEDHLQVTCACVVGGAGVAGMGFLFNALKTGTLAELARNGLIIVDASETPGVGSLGNYCITANSVGDVFIDCLRDPRLADIFEPLEYSPAYWRIRRQAHSAPPLAEAGELMAEASQLVLRHIVQHYGVKIWHSTTITEVIWQPGQLCVRVETAGCERRILCQGVVLNLGGRQDPRHLVQHLAAQGLHLSRSAHVLGSDAVLRMNAVQLREHLVPFIANQQRITVVGGSHSAFSVLENLADALEFAGLREVTLIHRTPIRLFYETVEQAQEQGFRFDPHDDVCPLSGRVNRSGGLRYRALDIGREVLARSRIGKTGVGVQRMQTHNGPSGDLERAAQALAEPGAVIQCTGYQPVLPVLSHADGTPIHLRQARGGLDSDANGCPLDQQGRRLDGLYLFGIGSGLAADPQLGSEPSFEGRIYGVWQFHHDASRVVIEALKARLQRLALPAPDHPRQSLVQVLDERMHLLLPGLVGKG
ncbi:pyridine nucleotide-disulfide oxidoreductase [Pseudomonas syringae]|nr:pyridine nucleotide-disulfide oxidoreductase [Pseudomonas syringae]MBD8788881.1 pyridine nucleotide-disulfide oxidoreductase [Pseudomonas syringae]MBD8803118.1 pyridine nucleotide-disulfide oxidoreductase [Pseudomonas syringae]MBD8813828.1 pyridine nucleotide-disulfide oxidoreductase [Pseudomonas syringae]